MLLLQQFVLHQQIVLLNLPPDAYQAVSACLSMADVHLPPTGLVWVLSQKLQNVPMNSDWPGFFYALGVGVSFAVVTIGLYATFNAGAPISLASPLVRLGGLVVASFVGIVFFHEVLTVRYVIGMLCVFLGLYLILTK